MITEILPILKTHDIKLDVSIKDNDLRIRFLLKVKGFDGKTKDDEADRQVLEQPMFIHVPLDKFDEDDFLQKLNDWQNCMIEGHANLSAIKESITARVNARSKKSTPKAKKETAAQKKKREMEEAREKQAKERAEQGDLFKDDDDGDRLGVEKKEKKEENPELKTAAEKAVERVTQKSVSQPTAEAEAEDIATAVETKAEPVKAEVTETDDDPFGLNDF